MDNVMDIYEYIMDRAQKLTTALYRVTDLLSDKEPLKWTLRNTAISVHDNLMSVKSIKDKSAPFSSSLNFIYQIVKLLELVSDGACVSNLNFEILKREYLSLRDFVEGRKPEIVQDQPLFLEFPIYEQKAISANSQTSRLPSRLVQDSQSLKSFVNQSKTTSSVLPAASFSREIAVGSRKDKILQSLQKNGTAKTVNEVALIFKGEASEKSIQRDLLDLVKSGEITALGDKRWRKYAVSKSDDSLAKSPIALTGN